MTRLFLLPLFLVLCWPIFAQESLLREVADPKTDTHIEVLSLFSSCPPTGYLPVRVTMVNNLKVARSARLRFKSQSQMWRGGLTTNSEFAFATEPGETLSRDILVPLAPPHPGHRSYGGASLSLQLTGSMGDGNAQIESRFVTAQPAVLLSEPLFTPNASALDNAALSSGPSHYGSVEFASRFDPKQLPDHWLAFSGYDSMLMTDTDWSAVPAGSRHAILSWVRMGGQLVIYTEGAATAAELGLPEDASLGEVLLKPIDSGRTLNPTATLQLVKNDRSVDPREVSLTDDFDTAWPLQKQFGTRAFRFGLFIFVLVIFGIVVGPVNLFVLAKSGRRHKLFITTPIISLVASVLLIALIILQDGFGGEGMRVAHMEVRPDAGQNAAFIHQEQFARTGLLTSKQFTLDIPATFTPVPIAKGRWSRYTSGDDSRGEFSLQPAGANLIANGDWFQSRSEQGHVLTAVVPTRGRIERTEAADTFLSTFDFPIETLLYLDADGHWHRADGISAGKRFSLMPINMEKPLVEELAGHFASRHQQQFKRVAKRPGHFIATTLHAPAIETHPGIEWTQTRTVITGPVVAP